MKSTFFIISLFIAVNLTGIAQTIFIEAESFENIGTRVVDQQSKDQMGSPCLLAHGLGIRCLYLRNVENLFMAGRNISVTHIAPGTVRVQ